MSRKDLEWAAFKVHQTKDGFWIKCSCYAPRVSGAYQTRVHVASVAEVRQWTRAHTCDYPTFDSAMAECRRMARRRYEASPSTEVAAALDALASLVAKGPHDDDRRVV